MNLAMAIFMSIYVGSSYIVGISRQRHSRYDFRKRKSHCESVRRKVPRYVAWLQAEIGIFKSHENPKVIQIPNALPAVGKCYNQHSCDVNDSKCLLNLFENNFVLVFPHLPVVVRRLICFPNNVLLNFWTYLDREVYNLRQ